MKIKYSLDSKNRLILKKNSKKILLNGKFLTDNNNNLFYRINEPLTLRKTLGLPSEISFIGNYSLDPSHNLTLRLKDGDILVIKSDIIAVENSKLVFEITSHDKDGLTHIHILKLNGTWNADEFNRINFQVKKSTAPDTLIFENAWEINKNQKLTYKYEKTSLVTKKKTYNTLAFEGFWGISSENKLTYALTSDLSSGFNFKVTLESKNLYPEKNSIKYRLGIGLNKGKLNKDKIITLFGTWKFNRKLAVNFDMDYGQGKIHSIGFYTQIILNDNDKVIIALKNARMEGLGIELTCTHAFLAENNATFFIRVNVSKAEKRIESGVLIPF